MSIMTTVRTRCGSGAAVVGVIGDAGDDAGLLEIADAVGDDAGRHDDEEVSRDREEAGQVEAHRSGVDRPAQSRPEDEADDDACRGG